MSQEEVHARNLALHENQAAAVRDVIESLRKLQQEVRALASAQFGIERRQEQVALKFLECAAAFAASKPQQEVARA